jgi:flagellar hook assembly protein FlgD
MDLNPVPDGDYRFQVNFYSDSDAFIPSRTYQSGKVQGLVFEGGKTLLDLGYARVPIQEILEVIETPALAAGEASSGQ